jgi:hypothetical protein
MFGVLTTGGLRRTLRYGAARYWLLFGAWMVVALPFSSWRGGSIGIVGSFWRTELLILFAIAGLVVTRRECQVMLSAVAVAAVTNLFAAKLFGHVDDGMRLSLSFGTVSNSSDFAAHLIFVLPFLLYIALTAQSRVVRILAFVAIGVGMYFVLATGSRGGAFALAVEIACATFTATRRRRIIILSTGLILLLVAVCTVPERAYRRTLAFSDDSSADFGEATESKESREYLLRQSIYYTFEHPLVGVGPGQFSNYEGMQSRAEGKHGNWHETHNSFTKASSECGIPALIFYLAAIVSTFRLLGTVHKQVRGVSGLEKVATAVSSMRLSIIGFCTAIFFLNFTYAFYLPAMTGLAIAVCNATEQRRQVVNSEV